MALNINSGFITVFMLMLRLVEFQNILISINNIFGTLFARLTNKELIILIFFSVYLRLNDSQSQQY